MADIGQKIDELTWKISTGVLFGLALTLALGRTCIKLLRFRRIFIDDIFFFLSIVFLVAGNVLGWVELPSMETVTFAEAGIGFTSFSDFIQRLVSYVKLSAAAGAMLNACNYCVKLSFMFFFRGLLRRLRGLLIWWWCVLMYIILTATACILSTAAVCPASGEAILVTCTTVAGKQKDNAILYTFIAADILADLCLISIPVFLLWRVKISIKRKLALASTLCLSIFVILTNIFRAMGSKLSNGQDDYLWDVFWLTSEACVSVIVVSFAAFRSFFVKEDSNHRASPRTFRNTWLKLRNGAAEQAPQVDLPAMPQPTMTGLRSMIGLASSGQEDPMRFGFEEEPFVIRVTHDIEQQKGAVPELDREASFV